MISYSGMRMRAHHIHQAATRLLVRAEQADSVRSLRYRRR